MKNFRELKVWEKSHKLSLAVYKATARFPREEIYGLTSQLRRASVSISANIAEGCGRRTDAELGHFLQMAMGSASELECLLLLSAELGLLKGSEHKPLEKDVIEVKRMLASFILKLKADR